MAIDAHTTYMRENVNPLYKMDQEEALKYAAKMGASDSLRGIAQGFGKTVGWETLTDSLKEKDKKLTAILNHPEYGTKANVAFLSSAVVADPLTYVPIAGWIAKGKKAKNLTDVMKYGAVTSGIVGGVGYTSEDRGLIVSDDSSFAAKKAEQVALSVGLGGLISGAGAKTYDVVSKARGNKGFFTPDEIIVTKGADDVVEQTENNVIKKGITVFLSDRNNQGQILSVNELKGTAEVFIVNGKTGKSVTKVYAIDDLKVPKKGEPKKTKEPIKLKKEKVAQERFIINKSNKRKGPVYILTDDIKNTTYNIVKVKDEKSGQFTNEWKVSREITKENPMTDPSGEMGSFPKLITKEDFPNFKNLREAKDFVRTKINPNYKKNVKLPKEESLKIVEKEAAKIGTPDEPRIINPILKMFSNITSPSFKDLNFGADARWEKLSTELKAESTGGLIGGATGISYVDEEDSFSMKFGKIMTGAITGIVGANRIKFYDDKYNNSNVQEFISRGVISDYGLAKEYLADKKSFKSHKSRIAMDFLDIVNRAEAELSKGQTKLLFNFMVGDSAKIDGLTEAALLLNKDARLLITKYGQEMVDLGVLNPKTFRKNIDTYLKRVYTNPDKDPKKLQNKIRAHAEIRTIGDELKARGTKPVTVLKTTFKNPDKKYQQEGYYIISEKGKKVTIRRDYTKKEREDLGEIEDVAFAIAETGRLLSNDVSVLKFFKTIKEKYAIDKTTFNNLDVTEQKLYKQVPEVQVQNTKANKYGDLSGMYLDKYTHNDLINTFRGVKASGDEGIINSNTGRLWDATMSVWKRTKTAWNIGTHVANTASNVILLDGADTSQKYLIKALKEFNKPNSKIMKDAQLEGVLDADMVANELSRKGSALEAKLIALENKNKPIDGILSGVQAMFNKARKLPDAAERLYQAEDHVFRIAVYMDRLDKGFSKADAALEARKWFIDYDINAPIIQGLKRTVLPFVSYTYRIAPLLAEIAVKRPIKFAKWAGVGYALNELGVSIADDKEGEDLDRFTARENDNKNMFGMSFMPSAVIRTPWDSANGDALYIDVSRWIPGGDVFETRQTEGINIPILPSPLQPGGPLIDLSYMMFTNRDPFTGKEIESLNDGDTGIEEFGKVLMHFLKKQPPNMPGVPGSYATEKLQKSLRVERPEDILGFKVGPYSFDEQQVQGSKYAVPFGKWEALVYGLGIKLKPVNEQVNMRVKENEYKQEEKKIQGNIVLNQNSFNRGSISEETYTKRKIKLEEEIIVLNASHEKYINKLRALELKFNKADAKKYNKEKEKSLPSKPKKEKNRLKVFKGGEVNVPYTKDEPEDRINPNTGESYADTARLKLNEGGTSQLQSFLKQVKEQEKEKTNKQDEYLLDDEGIKPVTPLIDLYLAFSGTKALVKTGSLVQSLARQRNIKKSIPTSVLHGSPTSGLETIKSGFLLGRNRQDAIYSVAEKNKDIANIYATKPLNKGLGSRYKLDTSIFNKETKLSLDNIKKLSTNKVLDTRQIDKTFVKQIDSEISRLAKTYNPSINSKLNSTLDANRQSLEIFKQRLKIGDIDDNYIALITPAVRKFLTDNNYNLMKQVHSKNKYTGEVVHAYVLLKNKVPVIRGGETKLIKPSTMSDPLKIQAMNKIFKD